MSKQEKTETEVGANKQNAPDTDADAASLLNPIFETVQIPKALRSLRVGISIAILSVVIFVALSPDNSSNLTSCHWNGVRCISSNPTAVSCKLKASKVFKLGSNTCIAVPVDQDTTLEDTEEASVIPMLLTMLMCAFVPLWLKVRETDKDVAAFAVFEFFSCAIGNGLLAATSLVAGHYGTSEEESGLAIQVVLWLLFALLYFPTGGHMNAALTAGAWACGQITFTVAVLYIIAQTMGCVVAMEWIRLLTPVHLHEHFAPPTPPYMESGLWVAGMWELICTVMLIVVSLACDLFDKYYIVASTLIVVLVRFTGASMDPLGAISGAWFAGDYSNQLEVYWVASIVGGLIAGFIWKRYEQSRIHKFLSSDNIKEVVGFATFEFFSCALGNGLLTATVLIAGNYAASDFVSGLAFQAMLWMLFAWLYFPTGGHMNASLTAGAWAAGQCTLGAAVLYIAAQTAGCVFAMEFLRLAFPNQLHEHFAPPTPPYMESGMWAAGGYELVCTLLLILVSLGCELFDSDYIIASTLIVVLVRFTGASMDPLGAICGAWFAGDYSNQLEVYWVASIVGGLIAGFIWKRYETSWDKLTVVDRKTVGFAAFEFFSCALGNWLLTATVLVAGHYKASDEVSDLAFQAMLWMLFALFYFPTGGHMNASLTAGAWAAGQCTLGAAVLYIIAQTAGCVFAMECVRFIAPNQLHEHFAPPTPPYMESGMWAAGGYELVCSTLLILVSLGCDLFDSHYVVASTLVVVLVHFTGASMDPLGAICGAWFADDYSNQLEVYWVASIVGGLIAGFIWKKYESRKVKVKTD